ncbi:hypothetical protein FRC08_018945, partial [Ceratobasidium sp. 394]
LDPEPVFNKLNAWMAERLILETALAGFVVRSGDQNDQVEHSENRLFRGNYIPALASGIPPSLVIKMFNAYVEMVTTNPTAKETIQLLELYHPDK